jgi:3-hydroxyisobutyrate dehydrogenase-like beta-hydroxyacid dehydrogenase
VPLRSEHSDDMTAGANLSVALIGLGEVGQALAYDLRTAGVQVIGAYDTAFADDSSRPSRAAKSLGVVVAGSAPEAARRSTLTISAVTAGSALDAARATAPGLAGGTMFLDVNSVSPRAKQEAAVIVENAGGRYVEAAVMSPIHPKGIGTPILLGGEHSSAFLEIATPLGFKAKTYAADRIGAASSVKMCRSIMVKGIESLVAECLMASHYYGVTDDVLASLKDMFPGQDWDRTARYMLSRTLEHGRRRSEEMREVAKTVADAGLQPTMSTATVERQQWAGELGTRMEKPGDANADRAARLDELRRLAGIG